MKKYLFCGLGIIPVLIAALSLAGCGVNAYLRVLQSGNANLATPFPFTCYGDTCTINGDVGY